MGRVIGIENPLGFRRTTIYDARGMVQAEIDPLGNLTTNAYGSRTGLQNMPGYRRRRGVLVPGTAPSGRSEPKWVRSTGSSVWIATSSPGRRRAR